MVATDILVTLHDVVIVEILCLHDLLRRDTYIFACRVLLSHDPHCINKGIKWNSMDLRFNLCQTYLRCHFLTTLIKWKYYFWL